MMKFITTIGAFALTFILSVSLVGFPKTNYLVETVSNYRVQQNISSLLTRDINNGDERDRKIYSFIDADLSSDSIYLSSEYVKTISIYVSESSSINDSNLPADFQLAWQSHMRAWREHARFLNRSKSLSKMEKFDTEEFSRDFARQDEEITVTWRKVLSIAEQYGATVSYQHH